MATTNYFYDLPHEIRCDILERCGKSEWKEKFDDKISWHIYNEARNRMIRRQFIRKYIRDNLKAGHPLERATLYIPYDDLKYMKPLKGFEEERVIYESFNEGSAHRFAEPPFRKRPATIPRPKRPGSLCTTCLFKLTDL